MRASSTTVAAMALTSIGVAQINPYAQDFEGLDQADPQALANDGWLVFGNVFDGPNYLYGYGPFPAPNGGPGFCGITNNQGGPPQGLQQLVVYSDYNNQDHGNGFLVEANTFQEQIVGPGDVGKTFRFQFDAKLGDLQPNSTATAFIKVIDNITFQLSAFVTQDMTNIPTTWSTFELSHTIDPGQVDHFFQVGFFATATNFTPSGIVYDNVLLEEDPGLVDCADLFLDRDTVPIDRYNKVAEPSGFLSIPDLGDPILDLRIAPPVMLSDLEAYICGVDYGAALDGGAQLFLDRPGPYFVRATRQSGAVEELVVESGDTRPHATGGCAAGPATEIPCKAGNLVLVSSTLGFAHTWGASGVVVNGIAQGRAAICAAYAANNNMPIQVSIDAHGSPGEIELGNDTIDINNIAAFVTNNGAGPSLAGKISKMTVYACSVARGAAGQAFINALGAALGITVTAYTGENWDTVMNTKWFTAGQPYENGETCPDGNTSGNYCPSTPFSTGFPSFITASASSASIGANNLQLFANNLPSQPGQFIGASGSARIPFVNGFLCVAPDTLQRLLPVTFADASGFASIQVDFANGAQTPTGSGPVNVVPGTTHYFQRWNRDPSAGAGSNLSNGIAVCMTP